MQSRLRIFATAAAFALMAGVALAQPPPQDLQAKFDQEPDVMRRARMLTAISRADFHVVSEQVAAGKNTDAVKTLQRFLDDAQSCSTALDARERNPESHPGGFKQIQIATRESLRRLDDLLVGLVADEQTPFMTIRKNLDQLNRHLIRELFPHQPQSQSPPAQPEVKP